MAAPAEKEDAGLTRLIDRARSRRSSSSTAAQRQIQVIVTVLSA